MDAALKAAIAAASKEAPVLAKDYPDVVLGRVVHIDGDYLAYQAAGNDDTAPGIARLNALDAIERFRRWAGAETAVVHLTAPGCHKAYRYLLATVKPYQGQRSGRHPKNWQFLRDFLSSPNHPQFRSVVWTDREADDGIAYCAQAAADAGKVGAIAAKDKDMRMLPGLHLDWSIPSIRTLVRPGEYQVIGENGLMYGHSWFWHQMLMGDSADHIPGLEKYVNEKGNPVNCGEKTAEKLLSGINNDEAAYFIVANAYEAYYGMSWDLRFIEQAGLLWLRRCRKLDSAGSFDNWMRYLNLRVECLDELVGSIGTTYQRVEALRAEAESFGS